MDLRHNPGTNITLSLRDDVQCYKYWLRTAASTKLAPGSGSVMPATYLVRAAIPLVGASAYRQLHPSVGAAIAVPIRCGLLVAPLPTSGAAPLFGSGRPPDLNGDITRWRLVINASCFRAVYRYLLRFCAKLLAHWQICPRSRTINGVMAQLPVFSGGK
jgi:hypothetical protein